ncbi:MAG: transporter ATP-binding protein [Rickettsiales bacterium]|jgi:ABC-2 type transport system ATP-binding protein|nr:transporter ATP-binding protein [Rickettsiales bacterium]
MPSDTPAISLRGLKKQYKSKNGAVKEALKGIDLDVPRGSFFGLLGPNGAGKSTLINILAGLSLKTEGTAAICGHDIDTDTRAARFAIGVVPQELVLDPFFPVFEALDNHAGYYGIPKAKRRTQEIIEAVGLTEQSRTPARRLSGGMKRRLLVAKALVHSPEVLILDEPTAGVDVELREQLWAYVRKLNKAGTTVLLTTHYLEEAQELCDRIAVIHHGELIVHEDKQKLLKRIDRKEVIITTAEEIQSIPDSLKIFDATLPDPHHLILTYRSTQTPFAAILQAIGTSGLVVKDLSTQEPNLEEVFRHLTKAKAA